MKHLLYLLPLTLLWACSGENTDSQTVETNDTANSVEERTPIVVDLTLQKMEENELPADCKFDGFLVDAHSWSDKNGKNYFIRTITEIAYEEESGETADEHWSSMGSQQIYAYHFGTDENGDIKELRKVQDYIDMCEFDLNMSHEINSLGITDIDEDSLAEVSFIYRLTCTSDVSPSTQKLLMLENGEKYILRGNTQVEGYGGDYEVDESFNNAPEGFLSHAEKLWAKHLTEYDFEM